MGAGADVLNITSTSADLNTLGATDALITGLETISASAAAAGVTITLSGQTEAFTITGSANADTITGGSGNDTLNGNAGMDTLSGGVGSDTINGGADNDTLYALDNGVSATDADKNFTNTINGGAGNDTLYGSSGTDTLNGGDGNDIIYSGTSSFSVADALAENTNAVYSATTGNFYEFVSSATTWSSASSGAASSTINGIAGHLVTITSSNEENFINSSVDGGNDHWIGASDNAVEDEWYWVEGPENGTQFWLGDDTGGPVGGEYNGWDAGDPSSNTGKNYAVSRDGSGWRPESESSANFYIIEWEGSDVLTTGNTTILNGQDGLDNLYGSDGGVDHFLFENASAFNDIDTVNNFVTSDGDALDISDILSANGYDDMTDVITDWIEITDSGADSVVKVDITGTATFGAGTQIATIIGVTGLTDEATLLSNGNIIDV
jgi:hypothetical protein